MFPDAWQRINSPQHVIDWISDGVPIVFSRHPMTFDLPNRHFSTKENSLISHELERLRQLCAIEECIRKPRCISPINIVPKKDNKYRLVINLRLLNSHCDAPKFSNEDIRVVKQLIRVQDDLATIDLKDGFLHVPVEESCRDYLGFRWCDKFYRFTKLPFGLALSPYYFSKIIRPIIVYLRSQGIRVVAFVDDFLLMSEPSCFTDHLDQVLDTLLELGWNVNLEKSSLLQRKEVKYLGYRVRSLGDSGYPEISITGNRIRKLRRALQQALKTPTLSARRLASITGQCIAMSQVIMPAKLLLRSSYRLLKQRQHWESHLTLTKDVQQELRWWSQYVTDWNVCPIQIRPIQAQLVTDASHIAWGATLGDLHASGQWTPRLARHSSNYRELMAILMGLQTFRPVLEGVSLQILTDNITAMAYIVNKGGPSKDLTQIAIAIWHLCHQKDIHIQASHIRGLDNTQADQLSRITDNYNWQLHPQLFHLIDRTFGPHSIDRFASVVNTQLPRFNSRFWEPETEGIDALSQQNWGEEMNFVNAPFRLLPEVISVIRSQKAEATVIAPWWPGQFWFRNLMDMSICPPIKIPNNHRTMRSMGAQPEPWNNRKWRIFAWRLSGQIA